MTHALMTGASGFIGGHLVRRLCEYGYDTTCLVRPGSDRTLVYSARLVETRRRTISGELGSRGNDSAMKAISPDARTHRQNELPQLELDRSSCRIA